MCLYNSLCPQFFGSFFPLKNVPVCFLLHIWELDYCPRCCGFHNWQTFYKWNVCLWQKWLITNVYASWCSSLLKFKNGKRPGLPWGRFLFVMHRTSTVGPVGVGAIQAMTYSRQLLFTQSTEMYLFIFAYLPESNVKCRCIQPFMHLRGLSLLQPLTRERLLLKIKTGIHCFATSCCSSSAVVKTHPWIHQIVPIISQPYVFYFLGGEGRGRDNIFPLNTSW